MYHAWALLHTLPVAWMDARCVHVQPHEQPPAQPTSASLIVNSVLVPDGCSERGLYASQLARGC